MPPAAAGMGLCSPSSLAALGGERCCTVPIIYLPFLFFNAQFPSSSPQNSLQMPILNSPKPTEPQAPQKAKVKGV